jgi:hypothetical protein
METRENDNPIAKTFMAFPPRKLQRVLTLSWTGAARTRFQDGQSLGFRGRALRHPPAVSME